MAPKPDRDAAVLSTYVEREVCEKAKLLALRKHQFLTYYVEDAIRAWNERQEREQRELDK